MEANMKHAQAYRLTPTYPAHATLAAHAATITENCFETTPRSLEKLPIPMPVIGGKRQPLTVDVFAAAVATIDDENTRYTALGRLPDSFARDVLAVLPKALQARAELMAAKRGSHTK
jgi:hypothetical protein